jgi:hypothetical protein
MLPPASWRKCRRCTHFDLELGQAGMRESANFMQAASMIPPCKMGVIVDDEGTPAEDNGMPITGKWVEFGACAADPEVVVWWGDTCDKWRRKIL